MDGEGDIQNVRSGDRLTLLPLELLYNYFIVLLDIQSKVALAATNKTYRCLITKCLWFDVAKLLSIFRLDASQFLELLRITHGVISGSAVLLLLSESHFVPKDLDVYVPEKYHEKMIRTLEEEMGFTEIVDDDHPRYLIRIENEYDIGCLKKVKWFSKDDGKVSCHFLSFMISA
jgi:hypothetical protein